MKSKKIITGLLTLLFISAVPNVKPMAKRVLAEEPNYAPYVKGADWGSPWGLFGTTEERDGLNIVYDGWYTTPLNPEYISANLSLKKLMPSIPSGSGYAQVSIFTFAFLTEQYTASDWSQTKKGLYIMTKNIEGNVHLDIKLHGNTLGLQSIYDGVLPLSISDLSSITLKTVDGKISLAVNETIVANEVLSTIAMSEITDTNGFNYFALQSYAEGGAGKDEDKRLLKLSYFATFEGQIPDPAVTADPVPIDGEEDYSAPAGLGLTAKKYNENVVQKDDGVAINNNALLFTALTSDCIEISGAIKTLGAGDQINIQLNKKQALSEATVLVRFTIDEEVLKCSFDGVTYVTCANTLPADFNLKIILVEDVYHIICNGEEITTTITKDEVTGEYGTFLSYAFTNEALLEVYAMSNKQLFLDVKNANNWDSPFDGITNIEGETVIFAHSTIKTPLDYKYVAFDFKVNGLLDTNIGEAHLGFALLRSRKIFDPTNAAEEGLHVFLRKKDGNLEVRVSLRTEFLGTIAILDWTQLGIDVSERITLRFINDAEKDTYRILLNDKEIKSEKMYEIMTIDASNRNDQTFLATSCWHDLSAQNENILAERSFVVYALDNKLDEGDIPVEITEIGKPEGDGGGETSENTSEDIGTSSETPTTSGDIVVPNPEDKKKKLWIGIGITSGTLVVAAAVVLISLIRKRKVV